eukprot:9492994-Pyramimonas_sp.AAC.1
MHVSEGYFACCGARDPPSNGGCGLDQIEYIQALKPKGSAKLGSSPPPSLLQRTWPSYTSAYLWHRPSSLSRESICASTWSLFSATQRRQRAAIEES